MPRITAKTRIAIGLVFMLTSVVLAASALGLMPDDYEGIMRQRAAFCETTAMGASSSLAKGDLKDASDYLRLAAQRNPDVLTATLIPTAAAGSGKASANSKRDVSDDAHMIVPIYAGDTPYGHVEIQFKPYSRPGILGYLLGRRVVLILFIAGASFVAFQLYLRKMLQHLDPSKAVPQRVRSALDNLVGGLIVLDLQERVVLANLALGQYMGKSVEQLVGTHVSRLPWGQVNGDVAGEFPWTKILRDGASQTQVQLQLTCHDGVVRTFIANCAPVTGAQGQARGVLVSLEDITELQIKEVQLRQSRDEANRANKAKSEFLALMSHEIRTPLNAILGFAHVLKSGYAESEAEKQEYLGTIHSSGQHLLTLINDILDLSKVEAGKLELDVRPCSPREVIREVVAQLGVRAREKGIYLTFADDSALPTQISTDPNRFRQMVINLAGNAIKFTAQGGVTLKARLSNEQGKSLLVVDISDTGIGMSKETLGKIFQPFVQADSSISRNFGGTGLGLSISKRLALALGGRVSVASEEGKGSTFTIAIDAGDLTGVPLATADQAVTQGGVGAKTTLQFAPARILVADDGEANRKLIRVMLTRVGLLVETAADGAEAVRLAEAQPFDLVMIDMNMPVMDGYEATRKLRQSGAVMPIVAITADAMKGAELPCLEAGCTDFLPKPIQAEDLMKMMARYLKPSSAPTAEAASEKKAPAPAPHAAEDPIRSRLPMDDADFREIVDEFITKLRHQTAAIQNAWQSKDLVQLKSLAHWLKGSGGTAGFDVFTKPATQMEQLAQEGDINTIKDMVDEIQQLVDRVQRPERSETAAPHVGEKL